MHLTSPYTPQQNPVAKIGNCTTTEEARTLLKQAGLPNNFWAQAVSTLKTVHLSPLVVFAHPMNFGTAIHLFANTSVCLVAWPTCTLVEL